MENGFKSGNGDSPPVAASPTVGDLIRRIDEQMNDVERRRFYLELRQRLPLFLQDLLLRSKNGGMRQPAMSLATDLLEEHPAIESGAAAFVDQVMAVTSEPADLFLAAVFVLELLSGEARRAGHRVDFPKMVRELARFYTRPYTKKEGEPRWKERAGVKEAEDEDFGDD